VWFRGDIINIMNPIQYPLAEKIGEPNLFVGREQEFDLFNKWIANIPKRLSKSKVILARRKSGKTVFVQRIFNQLWSANEAVIPFYFDFAESKIWYPNLAIEYYRAFASQYISFIERDKKLVLERLSLKQIRDYGIKKSLKLLVDDIDSMLFDKENLLYDSMWNTACSAPHRFANYYHQRFLIILDEFQNITEYVYRDEQCKTEPDETMAGSYHSLSESKLAPMLVTGSYVAWLIQVINKYLEAGRLKITRMSPYLTKEAGLQAVYKYAVFYDQAINNKTAIEINELCMYDPFVIYCVIQSDYPNKDLTTRKGVIDTVNYEFSDRDSEMSMTWNEYLVLTLDQVNDKNAKNILLWLYKYPKRFWNPIQLKEEMGLSLDVDDIYRQLIILSNIEIIQRGTSDYQFKALKDGTLNLIIKNRFQEEILGIVPNLKQEFSEKCDEVFAENKRLRGMVNYLSGKLAEYQLATAFRSKKRFALSEFFQNVTDNTVLNIIEVKERIQFQRQDGKLMEIDIAAISDCGRCVLVEVKKTKVKTPVNIIDDFQEKVEVYQALNSDNVILSGFLSLGGFTDEAIDKCQRLGIAMAEDMELF
jgi:hypothetical protein